MNSHSSQGHSRKTGLSKSTLLLTLCWVVYTCSYIGKLSYGANIKLIGDVFDVLNGFCYLGSTISMVGLGAISDKYDWDVCFYVLLGLIGVVVLVGIIYDIISKKHSIR